VPGLRRDTARRAPGATQLFGNVEGVLRTREIAAGRGPHQPLTAEKLLSFDVPDGLERDRDAALRQQPAYGVDVGRRHNCRAGFDLVEGDHGIASSPLRLVKRCVCLLAQGFRVHCAIIQVHRGDADAESCAE
jgi:hypothetical protein